MTHRSALRDSALALALLHDQAGFDDTTLARALGIPVEEIAAWRLGLSHPHPETQRRIEDLVAWSEALANARSGKYRQA